MSTITGTITADELYENPPKQRCELVRGGLRLLEYGTMQHGHVAAQVATDLAIFVEHHGLGHVLGAGTGFVLECNPDTVRAPDVAFVRADRIDGELTEEFFPGAPDLAVEVLSPNDSASEVHEKVGDWLRCGCAEVWLIDPRRKSASRCTMSGTSMLLEPVEVLTSEALLSGFELAVAELFA